MEGSKKAYFSGMGYAIAKSGKRVKIKSKSNRASFKAGFKAGTRKVK